MKRIRRVLYASDFSPASRRAFATAVAMASSFNAKLTIVYVIEPVVSTVSEQYLDAVTMDQLVKEERRWSVGQLEKLAARARRAGVNVATLVRKGDPADEIVRAGRSTQAELIVVGTHGRRGLQKVFLGSVAERVVATAACPVVTVRGK